MTCPRKQVFKSMLDSMHMANNELQNKTYIGMPYEIFHGLLWDLGNWWCNLKPKNLILPLNAIALALVI